MNKRMAVEVLGGLLPAAGLVLCFLGYWWAGYGAILLFYFLFGFVGLASSMAKRGRLKGARWWLAITCPYGLVPFRKSFYWFLRAELNSERAPDKALVFLQRVKPEKLYTDDNIALYVLLQALLHFKLEKNDEGGHWLEKARSLPHTAKLDAVFGEVEAAMKREEAPAVAMPPAE